MIRIQGASKGYLTEYLADGAGTYLDDLHGTERPYFGGLAAKHLGLTGDYDRTRFTLALEGQFKINGKGQYVDVNYHNSGVKKQEDGSIKETDAGFEVLISIPKTWSIAKHSAKGVTQEKVARIIAQAKLEAMAFIESNAMTRITENGVTRSEVVAGIAYTAFPHNTTRRGDMDSHEHVVIHRHALCKDGQIRSVDKGSLLHLKHQADAVMKTALNRLAAEEGLVTRSTANGPELACISDEIVDVFSGAREEIRAFLAAQGIDYEKALDSQKQYANISTKLAKVHMDEEHMEAFYAKKLAERGFDVNDLVRSIRAGKAYTLKPSTDALHAIDRALQSIHERSDVVKSRGFLVFEAARFSNFQISAAELDAKIGELIDMGEIIIRTPAEGARPTAANLLITTRYAVERERRAVDLFRSVKNRAKAVCSLSEAQAAIEAVESKITDALRKSHPDAAGVKLTMGQVNMVHSALGLSHNSLFSVVEGDPGTGKTTGMQAVKIAAEQAGKTVRGLAPSDNARDALSSSGIQTETVQLAVRNPRFWDDFDENTVLILDEAGMVDSETYNKIAQECATRGVRFVAVGDRKQLLSVQAGTPFELVAEEARRDGSLVQMDEMTRGRTREMRALHDMARDDPARAVASILKGDGAGSAMVIGDRDERIDYVAKRIADMSPEDRIRTPVIVDTNADRKDINDRIRGRLNIQTVYRLDSFEADSSLSRADHQLAATYRIGMTMRVTQSADGLSRGELLKVESRDGDKITVINGKGMEVAFNARTHGEQVAIGEVERVELGVGDLIRVSSKWYGGDLTTKTDIRNGDRAVVREISPEGRAVIDLVDFDGKTTRTAAVNFGAKGISIRSGHAATVHSVQGASIDAEGIYMPANTSKNGWLVAITRFKHKVHLVCDAVGREQVEKLMRRAQTPQIKERAVPRSQAEERKLRSVAVNAAWAPIQLQGQSSKRAAASVEVVAFNKGTPLTKDTMYAFLKGTKDQHGEGIVVTGNKRFIALAEKTAQERNLGPGFTFRESIVEAKPLAYRITGRGVVSVPRA